MSPARRTAEATEQLRAWLAEFVRLKAAFEELVAAAGTGTVGANLGRYAGLLRGSPGVALAHGIHGITLDDEASRAIGARAGETGVVDAVATTVADYLAAEKRLGRVGPDVDEVAFGFVIAGAVHNLLVSGDPYPKPTLAQVKQML